MHAMLEAGGERRPGTGRQGPPPATGRETLRSPRLVAAGRVDDFDVRGCRLYGLYPVRRARKRT